MQEETKNVQETQLKLMKLQTGMIAGILVILLVVGVFLMVQVNTVMQQVRSLDLDKINATVASLQQTAAELEKVDMEAINGAVTSLKGAAENLSNVDIKAINEGIQALTEAAGNLQGLDIEEMNGLIKSLETVAGQMEKTTSVFAKLFGK